MICPHCHNDTDTVQHPVFISKPMRMKNLAITSWCPLCHKVKGYSGILAASDDEGAVSLPETCRCELSHIGLPKFTEVFL